MAKTAASRSTGHHCAQVIRRNGGRAAGSSTPAATSWRTATTPAGPIIGNAWAPIAAPTWLLVELNSMIPAEPSTEARAGSAAVVSEARGSADATRA